MKHDLHDGTQSSRARLWAGLTLATVAAASSIVAIANAEGSAQHHARQNARAQCASSNPCLKRTNTSIGTAIQGTAASGPGLTGISSSGPGVFGMSSSYYGVSGSSAGFSAGVGGFNTYTGNGASGVYGSSQNGPGVTGQSQSAAGLSGSSTSGNGVFGSSTGDTAGVAGFNYYTSTDTQPGVYGESRNGPGVEGFADSSASFGVESYGDVFVAGEIYTSGSCHYGCTKNRHEATFAARTSQPTVDDVGEAMLREGLARVALASDFANAIDSSKPYVVLLTPEGDAPLYVASRNAKEFEVREISGGHSTVAFAYRIVAKPFGVKGERLPFKTTSAPNRMLR